LASHAGSRLLVALADKVILTDALSQALNPTCERRSAHDLGEVVHDLCVMPPDGGDCLSGLDALRDQEELFGRVASNATAFTVIDSLCAEDTLARLRAACLPSHRLRGRTRRSGFTNRSLGRGHMRQRPQPCSRADQLSAGRSPAYYGRVVCWCSRRAIRRN